MISEQFRVLLLRELYVLKERFWATLGDGATVSSMHLISLKYFLPAMGMDTSWQVPLYLGNVLMLCFTVGYIRGIDITNDIETSNFLHYQFSLPTCGHQMLYAYIFGLALHMLLLIAPIMTIGLLFLNGFHFFPGSIALTAVVLVCVGIFFASLFMLISIWFRPDRYLDSVWPRILGPMFVFGAIFYTWKRIFSLSPRIAYLFFLSPVLYCTEGLRGALLTDVHYVSFPLCFAVIIGCIVSFIALTSIALRRRLDPVEAR